MTTQQQLDAYFREMHMPLLARASEGFAAAGRGCLLIGWNDRLPPLCSIDYLSLSKLEAFGFSAEFVEHVRSYNPESEGLVYVKLGDSARMLKLEVERGEVYHAAQN